MAERHCLRIARSLPICPFRALTRPKKCSRNILNVPRSFFGVLTGFRGRRLGVSIVRDASIKGRGVVENIGKALRVRIPASGMVEPMPLLERWLRKQAREAICVLIAERSREFRRRPGRIFIMDQRTKWGGCSRRGNLSFNWRLIMAPPPVLDYVVVHELVHLAVLNHSRRFWLMLRSILPDSEQHKTWLRTHQATLRSSPSVRRGVEGRAGRLPSCSGSDPLV
jgi:YgjP-like, metallopeptidase domain